MKVVQIKTPDGLYSLPVSEIAEQRTEYYSSVDGFEKGSKEWDMEFEALLNDDYEAIDWLINNSDFEDWEDKVTKLNDVKGLVSFDDFWSCSDDFEVVGEN